MITDESIEKQLTRKPEVVLVTTELYDQAKKMLDLDDNEFLQQFAEVETEHLKPLLNEVDKFIAEQSELIKVFTEDDDEDLEKTNDDFDHFVEEADPNQAKSFIAQLKVAINIRTAVMLAFSKITKNEQDRKVVEENCTLYTQAATGMIYRLQEIHNATISCVAIIKYTIDMMSSDNGKNRGERIQKIVTAIADAVSQWTKEEIKRQGKEVIDTAVIDAVNDRICKELNVEKDLVMLQLDPDTEESNDPQYVFAFSYEDMGAFDAISTWYYTNEISKFANNIGVDIV